MRQNDVLQSVEEKMDTADAGKVRVCPLVQLVVEPNITFLTCDHKLSSTRCGQGTKVHLACICLLLILGYLCTAEPRIDPE